MIKRPNPSPLIEHFHLHQQTIFLNHGSYGATPKPILAKLRELSRFVERDPCKYFVRHHQHMVDHARNRVANFLDAHPKDLVFIRNATEAVTAIVNSLNLQPGDELLTTTHEYNACSNALRAAAQRFGAIVITASFPCPLPLVPARAQDAIVHAFVSKVSPKTKLVLVSQVTSPSACILPVERICQEVIAQSKKLRQDSSPCHVLIDAAHGPGLLETSLSTLGHAGTSWYVGNLHKWCAAPKGAAILYTAPHLQDSMLPTIISHGLNSKPPHQSKYHALFDYLGSADYAPWFTAPDSIDWMGSILGSWNALRTANETLRAKATSLLLDELNHLGVQLIAPQSLNAHMTSFLLPEPAGASAPPPPAPAALDPLYDTLLDKWNIQVPIFPIVMTDGSFRRVLRISAQIYNTLDQYAFLADVLKQELASELASIGSHSKLQTSSSRRTFPDVHITSPSLPSAISAQSPHNA